MNAADEQWRDVPGYEGRYFVSSLGRVRTYTPRGVAMILKPRAHQHVSLYRPGKKRWHPKVHRLVALAFIPNPDGKAEVNHLDGDRTNNAASNLEWAERDEQMRHVYHKLGTSNLNRRKGEAEPAREPE